MPTFCSATRNDYLRFYDGLEPRLPIIHLHLHENWGDADTHLPLFTGPATQNESGIRGLLARLRQRDFSGSMILEQWPHPPSLLNNARKKLLQLWDGSRGVTPPATPRLRERSEESAIASRAGSDFAAELLAGNERCQSWREKLDFVRGLLVRDGPALTADQLIDVSIYLQFLGAGQIACRENAATFVPTIMPESLRRFRNG